MNTKKLLVLLLALVMVISLWACNDPGEGDGTTAGKPEGTTTGAPETTTKAPETTTKAPETTTKAPETTTKAPETTEEPADPIDPAKPKHTVTFKADGKEIGKVEFSEGAKKINEPDVPAKEHYDGEWEDYTLGTTDITVNAVYTLKEYKVEFYVDGNRYKGVSYTIEDKTVVPPVVPAKAGYTGAWEDFEVTSGDIRVNAVYTTIEYTMTFKADGDTVGTAKFTVETESVTLPEIPEKENFKGSWPEIEFTAGDKTVNAYYAIDLKGIIAKPNFEDNTNPYENSASNLAVVDGKLVLDLDAGDAFGNGPWGSLTAGQIVTIYFRGTKTGEVGYALFKCNADSSEITFANKLDGTDQTLTFTASKTATQFLSSIGAGGSGKIIFDYIQVVITDPPATEPDDDVFDVTKLSGGIFSDPEFNSNKLFGSGDVGNIKVENGKLVVPNVWNVSTWDYYNQLSTPGTYRFYFKGTNTGEGMVFVGFNSDPHKGNGGVAILNYGGPDLLDGTDRYIDIVKKDGDTNAFWLVNGNVTNVEWEYMQLVKIA